MPSLCSAFKWKYTSNCWNLKKKLWNCAWISVLSSIQVMFHCTGGLMQNSLKPPLALELFCSSSWVWLKIQTILCRQARLRGWSRLGMSPKAHPKHTCEGARPLPRRIPPGGCPSAAAAPTCPAAPGGCWCSAPSHCQPCARPPGHSCTPHLQTQQGAHTEPFLGVFSWLKFPSAQ